MARSRSLRRRATRQSSAAEYTVTLRTGAGTGSNGALVSFTTTDKQLYPRTVAWNQWLVATRLRGRADAGSAAAAAVGDACGAAERVLAEIGVRPAEGLGRFLDAAIDHGVVQVELTWNGEAVGYAARLFPWEQTLLLAAREKRRLRNRGFIVVRWLERRSIDGAPADGPPLIVTTRDARDAPFGIETEATVVGHALVADEGCVAETGRGPLAVVASAAELAHRLAKTAPKIIHFMLRSVHRGIVFDEVDRARTEAADEPDAPATDARDHRNRRPSGDRTRADNETVAGILGGLRPRLVSLSSCYTGRRLAPLVVAAGADLVVALHQEVEDENLPAFFGRFYERWTAADDPVAALRDALAFNRDQPDHDGLGAVTLWSATDQLAGRRAAGGSATSRQRPAAAPPPAPAAPPGQLVFDCDPEESLNYSILHNSRGGLFRRFVVTALGTPAPTPLAVTVRLDTGSARPAECHFTCAPPKVAYGRVDLARRVQLPLGAELLRQRRETTRATVEVIVMQGAERLFHETRRTQILPADEWSDDRSGNHFLPSFIFPRDHAVREIISAAQPFLRAIGDRCDMAFDGYQQAEAGGSGEGVASQVRAIWSALQHGYRIDYANPPPAYLKGAQRIRTPSEILRARRATCIEISLLLASCWEHVGIEPVVFLIPGHAFCGYWTGEQARRDFLQGLAFEGTLGMQPRSGAQPLSQSLGGMVSKRDVDQSWLFAEQVHLRGIIKAVNAGGLQPVEATGLTLLRGFRESCAEARDVLGDAVRGGFDGMFDIRSARDRGVTPLPILLDGPAA